MRRLNMWHELPHFSPTGKRKGVIKRAWNPFGKQLLLLIFCFPDFFPGHWTRLYVKKIIISATKTWEQKSGIYIHSLVERILSNTCLLNERMWLFHMVIEKLWNWVHKSVFYCYFYAFTKLIPYILWNIAFTFTIRCIYTLPTQSHKH